jgi:hypothetical protein
MQRYLHDLQRTASAAIRRGATVREAQGIPVPEEYRGWGFTFMFRDNVARAYRLATAQAARRATS